MRSEKITDLTMTTIKTILLPYRDGQKCIGVTKKGIPCNNSRMMIQNCDDKGVCKKHLAQIPPQKILRLKNPDKLPKDVLKLLPFELWLYILELTPLDRKCKILYPLNGMMSNGETDGGWGCLSCGMKYKKKPENSVGRIS